MSNEKRKSSWREGTPKKKLAIKKDEKENDGAKTQVNLSWEVEGSKEWISYSPEVSSALNSIVNSKKDFLNLNSKKGEINVDLIKMVQKSIKSGWEKRVRKPVSVNEDGLGVFWTFSYDGSNWNYLDPYASTLIEDAFKSDEKKVSINNWKNEEDTQFNISKMTFKNKKEKGMFRREESKVSRYDGTNGVTLTITVSRTALREASSTENVKVKKSSQKSSLKSVTVKGKAPVDSECELADKCHVYYEGKLIWDCMLNQTNIQNNNNKYYLIQLLKDDKSAKYFVWMRWGRVGYKGQNALHTCSSDLEQAKAIFEKKFSDKTKNDWGDRNSFCKVPGKYDLVKVDYNPQGDNEKKNSVKPIQELKNVECKLNENLQALLTMICDVTTMEETVVEMQYDTNRAPLGKLTSEQIRAGYSALKIISDNIQSKSGQSKSADHKRVVDACNLFYTRIPHTFGFKVPPIIRTPEEVRNKMQLLETLSDIHVAMKLLGDEDREFMEMHPIDRHYRQLDCELVVLDAASSDFALVEKCLQSTHAKTHSYYTLTIQNIFKCAKKVGGDAPLRQDLNKVLLWHGSRISNWAGILGQGLKIAPPEAPSVGYMFGKGIYFADVASKSANYCFATKRKNSGLLLLCEVAIGETNDLLAANSEAHRLPKGKHSVKGLGKFIPSNVCEMSDGCKLMMGPLKASGVHNEKGYTLNYNEYIVYNINQVEMKYLVQVEFKFK